MFLQCHRYIIIIFICTFLQINFSEYIYFIEYQIRLPQKILFILINNQIQTMTILVDKINDKLKRNDMIKMEQELIGNFIQQNFKYFYEY
ncbi:hypothetical protein pb186bvf_018239 [Paramecium bursaria]